MKKIILAALIALLPHIAMATPRVQKVTLHEHTSLTVYLMQNLGSRFIFPFILDEQDSYVPYTSQITNPAFAYQRDPGRNSFVVSMPSGNINQVGNMFVTVAGYTITIELRTTNDPTKIYSDYEFVLTNEQRENLIQKGIQQRTQALEAEYKKKFADLDKLADQKAIARVGVLAMSEPTHTSIKEENKLALANGDKLSLYVREGVTFGGYTTFAFEVSTNSDSQGARILDAKLFSVNSDTKLARPIETANELPQRLQPNDVVKGYMTTLDNTLNPKELLKLQVLTDKGMLEVTW